MLVHVRVHTRGNVGGMRCTTMRASRIVRDVFAVRSAWRVRGVRYVRDLSMRMRMRMRMQMQMRIRSRPLCAGAFLPSQVYDACAPKYAQADANEITHPLSRR